MSSRRPLPDAVESDVEMGQNNASVGVPVQTAEHSKKRHHRRRSKSPSAHRKRHTSKSRSPDPLKTIIDVDNELEDEAGADARPASDEHAFDEEFIEPASPHHAPPSLADTLKTTLGINARLQLEGDSVAAGIKQYLYKVYSRPMRINIDPPEPTFRGATCGAPLVLWGLMVLGFYALAFALQIAAMMEFYDYTRDNLQDLNKLAGGVSVLLFSSALIINTASLIARRFAGIQLAMVVYLASHGAWAVQLIAGYTSTPERVPWNELLPCAAFVLHWFSFLCMFVFNLVVVNSEENKWLQWLPDMRLEVARHCAGRDEIMGNMRERLFSLIDKTEQTLVELEIKKLKVKDAAAEAHALFDRVNILSHREEELKNLFAEREQQLVQQATDREQELIKRFTDREALLTSEHEKHENELSVALLAAQDHSGLVEHQNSVLHKEIQRLTDVDSKNVEQREALIQMADVLRDLQNTNEEMVNRQASLTVQQLKDVAALRAIISNLEAERREAHADAQLVKSETERLEQLLAETQQRHTQQLEAVVAELEAAKSAAAETSSVSPISTASVPVPEPLPIAQISSIPSPQPVQAVLPFAVPSPVPLTPAQPSPQLVAEIEELLGHCLLLTGWNTIPELVKAHQLFLEKSKQPDSPRSRAEERALVAAAVAALQRAEKAAESARLQERLAHQEETAKLQLDLVAERERFQAHTAVKESETQVLSSHAQNERAKQAAEHQQQMHQVLLEKSALDSESASTKSQLTTAAQQLQVREEAATRLREEFTAAREQLAAAKTRLKTVEAELESKTSACDKATRELRELSDAHTVFAAQHQNCAQEAKAAAAKIASLTARVEQQATDFQADHRALSERLQQLAQFSDHSLQHAVSMGQRETDAARKQLLAATTEASAALEALGGFMSAEELKTFAAEHAASVLASLAVDAGMEIISADGGRGTLVHKVLPHGPAAAAGLKANDLIKSVDGMPTPGAMQFQMVLKAARPGQRLVLLVLRGSQRGPMASTVFLTLGAQGVPPDEIERLERMCGRMATADDLTQFAAECPEASRAARSVAQRLARLPGVSNAKSLLAETGTDSHSQSRTTSPVRIHSTSGNNTSSQNRRPQSARNNSTSSSSSSRAQRSSHSLFNNNNNKQPSSDNTLTYGDTGTPHGGSDLLRAPPLTTAPHTSSSAPHSEPVSATHSPRKALSALDVDAENDNERPTMFGETPDGVAADRERHLYTPAGSEAPSELCGPSFSTRSVQFAPQHNRNRTSPLSQPQQQFFPTHSHDHYQNAGSDTHSELDRSDDFNSADDDDNDEQDNDYYDGKKGNPWESNPRALAEDLLRGADRRSRRRSSLRTGSNAGTPQSSRYQSMRPNQKHSSATTRAGGSRNSHSQNQTPTSANVPWIPLEDEPERPMERSRLSTQAAPQSTRRPRALPQNPNRPSRSRSQGRRDSRDDTKGRPLPTSNGWTDADAPTRGIRASARQQRSDSAAHPRNGPISTRSTGGDPSRARNQTGNSAPPDFQPNPASPSLLPPIPLEGPGRWSIAAGASTAADVLEEDGLPQDTVLYDHIEQLLGKNDERGVKWR